MHYDAMTNLLIYSWHSSMFINDLSSCISVEELLGPVDQGPPVLHLIGASAGVQLVHRNIAATEVMGQHMATWMGNQPTADINQNNMWDYAYSSISPLSIS